METVSAIKDQIQKAILSLPQEERASLLKWFIETDKQSWDREITQDFSENGVGAQLLDKVKKDFSAGCCPKWD